MSIISSENPNFIVFYDSFCPLCVKEMHQLSDLDTKKLLGFADINATNFAVEYPHIDRQKANSILHGQTESGEVLLGLDVTVRAWNLVDKHRWLRVLRWPIVKTVADVCYLFFARNRYRISYLLTGQARCETCHLDTQVKTKPVTEEIKK